MNEKRKMQDTSKKPETMKGGEKEMKKLIVISMLMACVSSVFAVGGILADGQGTNQSYGVLNMRDQAILNADGAGITNLTAGNITPAGTLPQLDGSALTALDAGNITAATVLTAVDGNAVTNINAANIDAGSTASAFDGSAITALDAGNITAGTVLTAVDGGAVTNIDAANIAAGGTLPQLDGSAVTALDAANITVGSVASAFDGSAITNLTPAALTNALTDGNGIASLSFDGSVATSIVVEADGTTIEVGASGIKVGDGQIGITQLDTTATDARYIGTNATEQTKAGALTIEGVFTASDNVVLAPSGLQTLATDANVSDDAAITKVAGDGGAVTVGMDDGATEGQLLTIRGTSDANTVQLTNSAVVPNFMLGDGDLISFTWTGSVWLEQYRRDN